jgi:galactofuranose transport system ATP-binding protein
MRRQILPTITEVFTLAEPILVARNICKQFPGVRALDDVEIDLLPGEVHALLGENGAGKSTLIKIIGGLYTPTSGSLTLDGHPVHFANPLQSQAAGISVITQEFNLVPQLTVAENIFLGREPALRSGLIDWKRINLQSAGILDGLGLRVSPSQRVEYLSVADKQLVEIAKALSRDFRVIIMDEPTAALNAAEVERLFEIVAELRRRSVAVLYVSHRLGEIFRIADRVTVLRDGKKVGTRAIQGLAEKDVITMMLGRELEARPVEQTMSISQQTVAVRVIDLRLAGALDNVSFDLSYGEVLSCAGLIGSGRSELVRVLFGLAPHWKGEIRIDNKVVSLKNPREALDLGVFMLTDDRKAEGIFPDLAVYENVLIRGVNEGKGQANQLFIAQEAEQVRYQEIKEFLSIRAHSPRQVISTLSGGNQQKAIFGRALVSQSKILLLSEPTRGVDIGTKMEIHELIRHLARQGHAVLVSSSDIPELVKVSDRCLVLSAGKITGLLAGEQLNEDNVLACAVGHAKIGV